MQSVSMKLPTIKLMRVANYLHFAIIHFVRKQKKNHEISCTLVTRMYLLMNHPNICLKCETKMQIE